MSARLILASASPRRRELLEEAGAAFAIAPAAIAEIPRQGELPESFARRLAGEKSAAVAAHHLRAWILAADTVVAIDGEIFGKPADRAEARAMLLRLSGRAHHVHTGVVLRAPDGRRALDEVATTTVVFRHLRAEEIHAYVDSGEADDKAGAYAIQGRARAFAVRLDGSFTNVIGLPLELVEPALRRAGLLRRGEAALP